jgi:hypothetical protein
MNTELQLENLKGKAHLRTIDLNERIVLKRSFNVSFKGSEQVVILQAP